MTTMHTKVAISLIFLLSFAAFPALCADDAGADQTSPLQIQKAGMRAEWKVEAEYPADGGRKARRLARRSKSATPPLYSLI